MNSVLSSQTAAGARTWGAEIPAHRLAPLWSQLEEILAPEIAEGTRVKFEVHKKDKELSSSPARHEESKLSGTPEAEADGEEEPAPAPAPAPAPPAPAPAPAPALAPAPAAPAPAPAPAPCCYKLIVFFVL